MNDKKKDSKKKPNYEFIFKDKIDCVVSISLTDKPLFGEFIKIE